MGSRPPSAACSAAGWGLVVGLDHSILVPTLCAPGGIDTSTVVAVVALNTQVQVITEAPGLSPIEVEQYVTYPVETTMRGLPHVIEARSVSKFGISSLTIANGNSSDQGAGFYNDFGCHLALPDCTMMNCLPSCMYVIIPYSPGIGSSALARICPVRLSRA
jgi:hypothetical protein